MKRPALVAGLSMAAFVFIFLAILFSSRKTDRPVDTDSFERSVSRVIAAEGQESESEPSAGDESERNRGYRISSTLSLGYGHEPGRIGVIADPEQDIAGAESFTVDRDGNFIVCDTVNQRIQILNTTTGLHVDFALPDHAVAADVAVHKSGAVLLFDYAGRLDSFDFAGNPIGSIEVDSSRWDVRMGMHVVGEKIFMQCVDQMDHLVGIVEEGKVRTPTSEEMEAHDGVVGIHGMSGNRYVAGVERWHRGWVEVLAPEGGKRATLNLAVPGIVSLRFLGEDRDGNIYTQVERVESERVFLEVHTFDGSGEKVAVVEIPENDYYFWTVKLLSVDDRGGIYQALPQEGGMRFNVFQAGGKNDYGPTEEQ